MLGHIQRHHKFQESQEDAQWIKTMDLDHFQAAKLEIVKAKGSSCRLPAHEHRQEFTNFMQSTYSQVPKDSVVKHQP